MKNSILIATFVFTALLVWLLFGIIGYLLTDNIPFKEIMKNCIFFMFLFGWIVPMLVTRDVYLKLENREGEF